MKSTIAIMIAIFSFHALAMTCEISGEYRCRGGRSGNITGQGINAEAAKNHARERVQGICGGRVDYVRFVDATSTC